MKIVIDLSPDDVKQFKAYLKKIYGIESSVSKREIEAEIKRMVSACMQKNRTIK